MDKEKIKEAVKVYLQEENSDYAIMLNGKWGCGKTYFVKNELIKYIQEQNDREVIYISLFGITTIDELYNNISLHLVNIKANEYAQKKRKLYDPRAEKKKINTSDAGNVSFLSTVISKSLNLLPEAGVIKSLTADINNKIIKFDRYVFIFDDLERSSLGYDTLLGFFDKIADQNKLKAILVCDEDKIKNNHYEKFKEKVVGLTIEYNSKLDSEFDTIISYYVKNRDIKKYFCDKKERILSLFESADSCNLRTLIFACKRFTELYEKIKDIYIKHDTECRYAEYFFEEILLAVIGSSILIKEQHRSNDFKNNYNIVSNITDGKNMNGAYISYKFIDDYLMSYYCDLNIISYIAEAFIYKKKLDNDNIINKIKDIYETDSDELVIVKLNTVIKEIEENSININIYPKILDDIFVFTKIFLSAEKVSELKVTIRNNAHERVAEFSSFSWNTFEYRDSEGKVFKDELYDNLKKYKKQYDASEWLSIFDDDIKFVEKFDVYMQKYHGSFGFDGRNMSLVGAEKVFQRIRNLNIYQLKSVWNSLESVFSRHISNLSDSHSDDKEFFKELKEMIKSELLVEQSSKTKMQKLWLEGFCDYLDTIYNKL